MRKRVLSLALALVMVLSLLPTVSLAAGQKYDDTQGHWAESAIERWSGYKIVEGDDGHFRPDRSLTRGEMAKILANTLGLTDQGNGNPFADVPADAWYTPYVLRCAAAGIMEGDGVNAHPTDVITRQETMTVLCRALNIEPVKDADLSAYADGSTVADWAKGYVAAMTRADIVKGIGENQLAPNQNVTRGSMMAILDRSVTEYINAPGTYDLTGKEGLVLVAAGDVTLTGKSAANILVTAAANGKELTFDKAEVTGSITVQANNAKVVSKGNSVLPTITMTGEGSTLEESRPTSSGSSSGGTRPSKPTYTNLTIDEAKTVDETKTYQDVTITDAVGDGTVTLANMTILGNLYINGGGSNTINLNNVTIKGKIIMAKVGGEKPRLYLTNTPVAAVEVNQPAIIEAADATSTVTTVQAKSDVYVLGADTVVAAVTVPAGVENAVHVSVAAGSVAKVEAKGETTVTGATNAVKEVVAEAPVIVSADAVEKVEVPATAPERVSVAVNGSGSVKVAVNSTGGAAITTEADEAGNKASVEVTTELETLPTVTVDGEEKHIHQWGKWVKVDDYTHKRVCKADENHVETEQHPYLDPVKVDADTHKFVCPDCGSEYVKPHTIVAIGEAVAADCVTPGKTEGKKCEVCNTVFEEQKTIDPLGHDFTEAYVSDGANHWHKCVRCDVTDTKAAHTYPAGVSCDSATNCTVCNYEKAAGQHSYDEGKVTTAPTCTDKGVKTFTCAVCKQTKTEDVNALGHDWGEWTKADETNHKRTCKRDAAHTETETHTWDNGVITTEPTEDKEGVKTYTCATCKGTKTEVVPVVNNAITLTMEGRSILVTVNGLDYPNYWFKIVDDKNVTATSGWSNINESSFPGFETYLPRSESGTHTYSLVVYGADENFVIGNEIARLNDCIVITVSGEAADYDIQYNTDTDTHTISWMTPQNMICHLDAWYNANGKIAGMGSGWSSITGIESTLTEHHVLADGDVFDLRVITSLSLDNKVIKATMTPPSTKTYTAAENPPVVGAATLTLIEDGGKVKIVFDGVEEGRYGVCLYDENGKFAHIALFPSQSTGSFINEISEDLLRLPYPITTTNYSLVLYPATDLSDLYCFDLDYSKELARLDNAITITVDGVGTDYEVSYNTDNKTSEIVWKNGTPNGLRYYLYNKSESIDWWDNKTFGSIENSISVDTNEITSGQIDVRIMTSFQLDSQVLKIVMTPPSAKIYTAPTEP